MKIGGGRDGRHEGGGGTAESVVDEVLGEVMLGREMLGDVGHGELVGAREDGAETHGVPAGGFVSQSVLPGKRDSAAVLLVLAGEGEVGGQALGSQGADGAEGGTAERTEGGLLVAGRAGQMPVVALPDSGWRAGMITHRALQDLPGVVYEFEGCDHVVVRGHGEARGVGSFGLHVDRRSVLLGVKLALELKEPLDAYSNLVGRSRVEGEQAGGYEAVLGGGNMRKNAGEIGWLEEGKEREGAES